MKVRVVHKWQDRPNGQSQRTISQTDRGDDPKHSRLFQECGGYLSGYQEIPLAITGPQSPKGKDATIPIGATS